VTFVLRHCPPYPLHLSPTSTSLTLALYGDSRVQACLAGQGLRPLQLPEARRERLRSRRWLPQGRPQVRRPPC
jgi:hypothetical protein